MRRPLFLAVPLALTLTGCGGSSGAGGPGGAPIVISAGDRSCDVAPTELTAGKHEFTVTNNGGDVTEVYVYGKGSGGAFDRVAGEAENITPKTSRTFPVTLGGGDYEVACKPGQKGAGIRTRLTVSGAPAGAAATQARKAELTATEYAFTAPSGLPAKVGDRVEFALHNSGTTQHELEVVGPDGSPVGEVGPTEPGQVGAVVLTLPTAGTYTYLCGINDHAERGMKGTFTVS